MRGSLWHVALGIIAFLASGVFPLARKCRDNKGLRDMSITAEKKQEVIADFRREDKDTGSPEVQVAILTARIKELTEHLKQHRHDYASQRGLLQMVSKRTRLLRYLKNSNRQAYLDLIGRLGLRK